MIYFRWILTVSSAMNSFSPISGCGPRQRRAEEPRFHVAEVVVAQVFGDSRGNFPWNTFATGMNPADRFEYLLWRYAL
jgi:hypothetical protein